MRLLRWVLPLVLVAPVAAPLTGHAPEPAAPIEGRVHALAPEARDLLPDSPAPRPDEPPVDPIGLVVSHLVPHPPEPTPPSPEVSYGPWHSPEVVLERTGSADPPTDTEGGRDDGTSGHDGDPMPSPPPALPPAPAPGEPSPGTPGTGPEEPAGPTPPPADEAPPTPPRRCFLLCIEIPLLARST